MKASEIEINKSKIQDMIEASYPGNIGAMEVFKFFQQASPKERNVFQELVKKGENKLAWALIQKVTGVKLQGKEFDVDEGWKDWVGGAALGAAVATGGPAAYDAYKSSNKDEPKVIQVQKQDQVQQQNKEKEPEIKSNAVPKKSVTGSPHEKFLTKAAIDAGIKGTELAQFLAQTAHESHNFKSMVEYGEPSYFKKYEPKFAKDKKTGKIILDPKTKKAKNFNPKAVTLGNDTRGDGERYKGRGYIQLTGKYNYERAGKALGLDLVKNPELVEKPEIAAKVAVWFWQNRVQPRVDNFNNTKAATKPINPGLKGLDDRKEKFQDFKVAMR